MTSVGVHALKESSLQVDRELHVSETETQFGRWEPEPGEVNRQSRRASKWDSMDADMSLDTYQQDSHREPGRHTL